ncbi:RDD family protein [Nocardia sp. NPDC050406]|uniref:RDD family protein n=1 Tax=Nocardia sp. NPDC050406 TaxID=3364318 RepID=UPI003792DCD5
MSRRKQPRDPPAPFPRRLAARLVDLAVYTLVIPGAALLSPAPASDGVWVVATLSCFALYVAVETFLTVRCAGRSLGKWLFGLRVIPLDPTLARLPPSRALLRASMIHLPLALLVLAALFPESGLLGMAAYLTGELALLSVTIAILPVWERRTLHDLAAGSRVVRVPARAAVTAAALPRA